MKANKYSLLKRFCTVSVVSAMLFPLVLLDFRSVCAETQEPSGRVMIVHTNPATGKTTTKLADTAEVEGDVIKFHNVCNNRDERLPREGSKRFLIRTPITGPDLKEKCAKFNFE